MQYETSKTLLGASQRPLYLAFPSLGKTGLFSLLFLLTLFHVWLAGYFPPTPDELYYWTWSQSLQWSYFDHPPMVAYWIRMSTALFGNSIFAIRLPALIVGLFLFLALLKLAPRGNLVLALLFCPVAFFGSVLFTPDLPLLFFWLLYTIWFAWINRMLDGWNHDPVTRVYRNSPVSKAHWILGGALLGFGGLSKYTMALAVPCGLLVLVTRTQWRAWGPGYAFHLLVAGTLTLPVFLFNWHHQFAPLAFQWAHSMSGHGVSLKSAFEFLAGQTMLLGALPFLILPWILLRRRELCADPTSAVFFWFFVFPLFFFLYKSFRSPLEANWALVTYLTFLPLADRLLSWSSFKGPLRALVVGTFAIPWTITVLVLIHMVSPFAFISPERDRLAKSQAEWAAAQTIADAFRTHRINEPIWAPNYQWVSYLRFLGLPSEQLASGRVSEFSLGSRTDPCTNETAVGITLYEEPPSALKCFSHREVIQKVTVVSREKPIGYVWLTRFTR